jgi:nitroreductase
MERSDVIDRLDGVPEASAVMARLLAARFSCRAFLPTPVPQDIILRIFEIAQLTPSWCNTQPWQVIVTEGQGTERLRRALYAHAENPGAKVAPDFSPLPNYEGVYLARRRECGGQLYESVGIARGDKDGGRRQGLENYRFFGAPHAAIVTTERELGLYGAVDCGAWIGSFTLVAQSFGVASIPQAALAMHSPFIRDYFGLPEERRVLCGISFGYADEKHAANAFRTRRAEVSEVVRFCER